MIIPHHMLSPEALYGVIEAFITREGTDYGVQDIPHSLGLSGSPPDLSGSQQLTL